MNVKKYIILVLSIVSVFVAVTGGIIAANLAFQSQTSENNKAQPDVLDKTQPFQLGKKINVLIMGTDGSEARSDVMIVASLDSKNKKLNMLSIPRDTRVKINNKYQKINAALTLGKEELAIRKVKEITGMPIHYYVTVNFKGFRNIIDILGGVDIDVPVNMNYDDPVQDLHIHLKKGMQHLDGKKAEQFVRYRQYPEGDIGRIKAQQAFIKALLEQKLRLEYLSKANDIFKAIKENVKTNITAADVAKNLSMIKALNSNNIQMYQLPGEPKMINGASYFVADDQKTISLIEESFGYKLSLK
ncbi:MAG: polyisoprenyl-teichoic acid--peptidoglycan teichoic acid transferase [Petroclostridium sp.]|jgi:LCP family protein required for cell wall assembly|uniref:LCP family protein n=1 Tax=Petroclostridium xylanilyticum TaxID=1792311 RepID=UPI000B99D54E|nr:LCP family protein [Petroclostridium xylanilyticum]MBZ4645848.1 cell envelope-related transcriptional attenuator [Clostridia bacterium]MDK2809543.1 polyisoprenyl-teichoic acid--peptidoglycan teichoic acid transferase [Petroclostridium sp.]